MFICGMDLVSFLQVQYSNAGVAFDGTVPVSFLETDKLLKVASMGNL